MDVHKFITMKILIPILGFGKAGGYRVLSELASHWIRSGADVMFLVDQRSPDPYFPTTAQVIYFNANGLIGSVRQSGAQFGEAGDAVGIYMGMWRAINKIGEYFDIILANHSLTTIPVFLSKTARRKKFYYVQAYEPEYYEMEGGIKSAILKLLSLLSYHLPLRQIANAPIYIGYKSIKAKEWIPPGLDRNIFYRRNTSPLVNKYRKIIIGVIGRSEPAKGISFALRAFEQLSAVDDRYSLSIAFGNLPDGWSHPKATVTVPKNDAELAEFYRAIDILVAPGIVQLGACHYPVLEGMACGTPVVTTGYLPANSQNSWLVPIMNANAITVAIKQIEALSYLELKAYLDRAEENISPFSWEQVAGKFLRFFKSV